MWPNAHGRERNDFNKALQDILGPLCVRFFKSTKMMYT